MAASKLKCESWTNGTQFYIVKLALLFVTETHNTGFQRLLVVVFPQKVHGVGSGSGGRRRGHCFVSWWILSWHNGPPFSIMGLLGRGSFSLPWSVLTLHLSLSIENMSVLPPMTLWTLGSKWAMPATLVGKKSSVGSGVCQSGMSRSFSIQFQGTTSHKEDWDLKIAWPVMKMVAHSLSKRVGASHGTNTWSTADNWMAWKQMGDSLLSQMPQQVLSQDGKAGPLE